VKFQQTFQRYKGGGGPAGSVALGADAVPTVAPNAMQANGIAVDNVLSLRFRDWIGFPVHRIAVALTAPAGTTVAIPGAMYLYEESTSAWYRIGPASVSITTGVLAFFDTLALVDAPSVTGSSSDASALARLGSPMTQALLVLSDPGAGAANGKYSIAMAGDLHLAGA